MAKFVTWLGKATKRAREISTLLSLVDPGLRYKRTSNCIVSSSPFQDESKSLLAAYGRHFIVFRDTSVKKENTIEWVKHNNTMLFKEVVILLTQRTLFPWEMSSRKSYKKILKISYLAIPKIFKLMKRSFIRMKNSISLYSQQSYIRQQEIYLYKNIIDGTLTTEHHSKYRLPINYVFQIPRLSGRALAVQTGVEQ